ncbi:hypothetical protein B296_00047256 [Ensete ventricosum]|uniref:Uncharacterized protein n=1 Tax=Ensete ventricosum TaxID=4639 RepID=A0A426XLG9_ENSVE|nr:hypothetical protein B296_00047256 [Ensete ventricosum]
MQVTPSIPSHQHVANQESFVMTTCQDHRPPLCSDDQDRTVLNEKQLQIYRPTVRAGYHIPPVQRKQGGTRRAGSEPGDRKRGSSDPGREMGAEKAVIRDMDLTIWRKLAGEMEILDAYVRWIASIWLLCIGFLGYLGF